MELDKVSKIVAVCRFGQKLKLAFKKYVDSLNKMQTDYIVDDIRGECSEYNLGREIFKLLYENAIQIEGV